MPAIDSFLHTLIEWELDGSTVYGSFVGTSTPSRFYEGRVLSISSIQREIPMECGLYSVANVDIVWDNSDNYLSHRKASEAWRNRTMRILLGYPDQNIASFSPAMTGIVTDIEFDGSTVRTTLTDDWLARLDIPITEVIPRVTPGGYPDAAPFDAKPDLIPYVAGTIQKPVGTDESTLNVGQLPARRINDSTFAYALGLGNLDVIDVYVYGVRTNSGFTLDTFTAIGGELITRLTFTSDPRDLVNHTADEIEVTWNGLNLDAEFRPLYQLMNFLVDRGIFTTAEFDLANLDLHAQAMDDRGIQGAWAIIDSSMTVRDVVSEFLNSHACRMYRQPNGVIAFDFLGTVQTATVDLRETNEILDPPGWHCSMNSVDNVASRLQVNWDWNYVREFYARQPDLNSPSEQNNLRFAKRRNKSLRYARTRDGDDSGPFAIGAVYFQLMKENVQFVSVEIPASYFDDIELGDVVTVTHSKGIGASGYVAQRVKILSMQIQPSPEVSRLALRVYVAEEPEAATVELSATFQLAGGLEVILEAA
jgi:hypothetical protein